MAADINKIHFSDTTMSPDRKYVQLNQIDI